MNTVQFLLITLMGLSIGSFGNVLLYRLPKGGSITGRSKCPSCSTTLHAHELLPLLSFFLLRGKCRTCKAHISWRYPLVEAATAAVFILAYLTTHEPLHIALLAIASTALILIAMYDAETHTIPDDFTLTLVLSALVLQALKHNLPDAFAGALIPFIFFGALWMVSRGAWIGSGDILLGVGMGLLLGSQGVLHALFVAYTTGGIVAAYLLLTKRAKRGTHLAFGPFLVLGTLAALYISHV